MQAKLIVNKDYKIGQIDERLYGSFIEQLGRAVYGGIYEPTHPTADEDGFRQDVLELVKEMHVPVVRYPGGNFVSGYRWEDGTGPKEKRPRRADLAWFTIEDNSFGIDEFQKWCKKAGTQVMEAVNLGTRGPQEAQDLVEYCNFPGGTKLSEKRKENGYEQPFDIKLWCLGNEMDGPWQIGAKTAEEYGRVACEAAKMMKWIDPSIELVACGSSGAGMATFGKWEQTVLENTYPYVDYLSLHSYYSNRDYNAKEFLSCGDKMDAFIKSVIAICDYVKALKKSDKTIYLSFDEWNVWYHSQDHDRQLQHWEQAPHRCEEAYTFLDALAVGSLLLTLINHADRVKIACMAQLVNVIAPISTVNGGPAWAQTIYYPMQEASLFGRGTALQTVVEAQTYNTETTKNVSYLQSAATYDEDNLTVFALNRNLEEDLTLTLDAQSFDLEATQHILYTCEDMDKGNTCEEPNAVLPIKDAELPKYKDGVWKIKLPKASWNVLRFKVK